MERPFKLFVDSGSRDEPADRRFGSLTAAYEGFEELDPKWQKFAWIVELRDKGPNISYMRDGRQAQ